ncbi:MAG: hypothetical protein DRQ55_09770 [Planctomycetota bacterium]|nr:MAG: hypothetical protein DRQ55_09770 [Planctomycetota bacterium]
MSRRLKKRTFDRDDGAQFLVQCLRCSKETDHHVIRSVSDHWDDEPISYLNSLQIIECRGCKSLSVRHDQSSSEDLPQRDAYTGEQFDIDCANYYPPRARSEVRDSDLLPSRIRNVYRELLVAHGVGLHMLAQVGLGCLIEAICDDLGEQGTLRQKIGGLVGRQILRGTEAKVLHKILDCRNDAAHRLTHMSKDKLAAAIEVVEHVLVALYLLDARRHEL